MTVRRSLALGKAASRGHASTCGRRAHRPARFPRRHRPAQPGRAVAPNDRARVHARCAVPMRAGLTLTCGCQRQSSIPSAIPRTNLQIDKPGSRCSGSLTEYGNSGFGGQTMRTPGRHGLGNTGRGAANDVPDCHRGQIGRKPSQPEVRKHGRRCVCPTPCASPSIRSR